MTNIKKTVKCAACGKELKRANINRVWICDPCFNTAKKVEKAEKLQKIIAGAAELTGSEKQIEWATDIRIERLIDVDKAIEAEKTKNNTTETPAHIKKLVDAIKAETSAKTWIDMRNWPTDEIFRQYFKK